MPQERNQNEIAIYSSSPVGASETFAKRSTAATKGALAKPASSHIKIVAILILVESGQSIITRKHSSCGSDAYRPESEMGAKVLRVISGSHEATLIRRGKK